MPSDLPSLTSFLKYHDQVSLVTGFALKMAQNFSTGGQTAGVLLQTIPKAQQIAIAKELIIKLRSQFDDAAASVAIELVSGQDDATLQNDLLDVLRIRIESGFPDSAASLLKSSSNLSSRLMVIAADFLADPKARLSKDSNTDPTTQLPNKAEQDELSNIDPDKQDPVNDIALQWLRYAKQNVSTDRTTEREDSLFGSALRFLNDTHRSTALAARDLVFSLISSKTGQNNLDAVRESISSLISARDAKLQQTLGYALWMRLLASSDEVDLSSIDLIEDSYWSPLLSGLRNGDAERRKMCLDILKRSVALAIEQEKPGAVASKDTGESSTFSFVEASLRVHCAQGCKCVPTNN